MSKTFTDEEVTQVRRTLALHRSMAACGEQPSAASEKEIQGAFDILDKPQPSVEPVAVYRHIPAEFRYGVEWLIQYPLADGTKLYTATQPSVSARDALMELMEWVNHYFGQFPKQVLLEKIDQIIKERGL